jgi:phosphate-selective porin OprO/OprP
MPKSLTIFLLAAAPPLTAGAATPEPAAFDALWNRAVLLKGAQDDFFQELRFTGRTHLDWYSYRNDARRAQGVSARRTRTGLRAEFLRDFVAYVEVDYDLDAREPLYSKIGNLNVQWNVAPDLFVTVGKQPSKFTLDGSTSANQLLTIDRSALAKNVGMSEESQPGVTCDTQRGPWHLRGCVFSSGAATPEFGRFNAGILGIVSVGYDAAPAWKVDQALLRADFMLQSPDHENATGGPTAYSRNHEKALSLSLQLRQGPWGLGVDVGYSEGRDAQPDLHGIQVMPSYAFSEAWQVVFRYTYVGSAAANGVSFTGYESKLTPGKGDRFDEFYFGLNRYFYGHKLKCQLGVEHTRMLDDPADGGAYHGWGVVTAVRVSW